MRFLHLNVIIRSVSCTSITVRYKMIFSNFKNFLYTQIKKYTLKIALSFNLENAALCSKTLPHNECCHTPIHLKINHLDF